jgi:hypothetical protein
MAYAGNIGKPALLNKLLWRTLFSNYCVYQNCDMWIFVYQLPAISHVTIAFLRISKIAARMSYHGEKKSLVLMSGEIVISHCKGGRPFVRHYRRGASTV